MKPYPEYKDSRVAWLGEIPMGWKVKKLKHCGEIVNGSTPKSGISEYWNGEIVWFTPDDLGKLKEKVIHESSRKITETGLNSCGTTLTPKNSIILSTRAPIGHIGISQVSSCTNQGCKTIVPNFDESNVDFIYYFLYCSKEILRSLGRGSTFIELSSQSLKDFGISFPSLPEQHAIAAFLDRKTSKIDTLIQKKELQIELLKEQRAATINQAVTKGLDPTVPMKESGVEWLGEIPEGWSVKPLKYALKDGREGIKIGPFGSSLKLEIMVPEGIKVYGQENIIKDDFSVGHRFITKSKFEELKVYELLSGDVVVTTMGTTGKSKVVPINIRRGIMDSHLIRIRLKKNVNPYLISLAINDSYYLFNQFKLESKGSIMEGLNSTIIKSLLIAFPPFNEQNEIMVYLNNEFRKVEDSIQKAERQIQLLREYRTALISAAVTGKIDVREAI